MITGFLNFLFFGCKDNDPFIIPNLPRITTLPVINITENTAECGGNISNDGGAAITAYGVCWSSGSIPTIANSKTIDGTGTGNFKSTLTGLKGGYTNYFVRAYATNATGTGYGEYIYFTTSGETITDIDGNSYKTVKIGNQIWMAENLKTRHYNDGTAIPLVANYTEWMNLLTPAYCWYNNDSATYNSTYGLLYNWHAVNTGNLCPTGWHVPSDAEWIVLSDNLGGVVTAGGKLKETGLAHWKGPNAGATNESGFTALPGGYRVGDGAFICIGDLGYWWTSSGESDTYGDGWALSYYNGIAFTSMWHKESGFSVRCVKDE